MKKTWTGKVVGLAFAAAATLGATAAGAKNDADERDRQQCPEGRELTLSNGRIHDHFVGDYPEEGSRAVSCRMISPSGAAAPGTAPADGCPVPGAGRR